MGQSTEQFFPLCTFQQAFMADVRGPSVASNRFASPPAADMVPKSRVRVPPRASPPHASPPRFDPVPAALRGSAPQAATHPTVAVLTRPRQSSPMNPSRFSVDEQRHHPPVTSATGSMIVANGTARGINGTAPPAPLSASSPFVAPVQLLAPPSGTGEPSLDRRGPQRTTGQQQPKYPQPALPQSSLVITPKADTRSDPTQSSTPAPAIRTGPVIPDDDDHVQLTVIATPLHDTQPDTPQVFRLFLENSVFSTTTVRMVKIALEDYFAVPATQQLLSYRSAILDDSATLSSLGIPPRAILFVDRAQPVLAAPRSHHAPQHTAAFSQERSDGLQRSWLPEASSAYPSSARALPRELDAVSFDLLSTSEQLEKIAVLQSEVLCIQETLRWMRRRCRQPLNVSSSSPIEF